MSRSLKLGALALIGCLAGTAPAAAQGTANSPGLVTTGTLAEVCGAAGRNAEVLTGLGYCRGFLVAVGQFHNEITRAPAAMNPVFCLPANGLTLEAVQVAFVAWVQANPQHAGERAIDGVLRFAAATYPCPPAPPRRRTR